MATGDQRAASDVLKAIARHLNCLNEGSKNTKKRALESIKRETIDKGLSSDVLQEVFTSLLKSLLKCLSDPMERCRETAIQMIGDFIRCVPKPEDSLPYLMPTLAHRLGGKDIVEPAEELRLAMMEVLSLTVEVCGRQLTPYLDDVFKILQRTIIDPFPDVKRESCKCTVDFAKSTPEHFHMQAESLVKPLMLTISHQHSRVRVGVIEATGAVIQHGTGKNVDDVLSHLAQRLFDDSPQVRKAVTVVVGGWLLHLRDRYSYFHKLLPLLLSSFSDEIPEIRALSTDLWKQVGSQWERENEEDLKDKLDFLLSPPALYPAGVERPGLGCRELVVRNLSKLVPALSRDLTDWLPATRLKTARLLSVLLLHAEDHCTQHLQPLLATLYRACADAEPLVAPHCLDSAKLLGTFVSPEVFLKLLLAHVENSSSSSSSSPWTPLMVLAAALRGSSGPLLRPHLARVADTLAHPDVCQGSQQVVYLEQLVACVDALLEVCASDCGTVSLPLLKVLVTVESLSAQPELQDKVEGCVTRLGGVQSVPGQVELFRQHMAELLRWLADGLPSWSRYSVQSSQLGVVLTRAGPVVGEFLPELMSVLQGCVQASREPELRLHILTMLARLLLNAAHTLNSQGRFGEYVQVFLAELLLPNLVWHAGRTSAALRTAALTCLLTLLQGGGVSPAQVLSVEANLTPQLLSALEEDSRLARRLACTSICSLLTLTAQQLHPDTLNKIYPELLKRVDDSSEEVRVEALGALGQWFSSLGPDYEPQASSPHLQLLFQQLLLYLDDPDGSLQDTVLEVLRTGSAVHPGLLQQEVEAVRDKQRNPASCDQLLQHIESLSRS